MNGISFRRPGTQRNGSDFSLETRRAVWAAARPAPQRNPNEWRLDSCGALIRWSDYGKTDAKGNGWEIDHILPVAKGGQDWLNNLQALQWENNRNKSDRLDANYCLMRWQPA